jgi:hypothetical protein
MATALLAREGLGTTTGTVDDGVAEGTLGGTTAGRRRTTPRAIVGRSSAALGCRIWS